MCLLLVEFVQQDIKIYLSLISICDAIALKEQIYPLFRTQVV